MPLNKILPFIKDVDGRKSDKEGFRKEFWFV